MGTEKELTKGIRASVLNPGGPPLGREFVAKGGGTPNHWKLARSLSYLSANDETGRQHALEWLASEDRGGFWSHADADEWGSTSHAAWHLNAEAATWYAAVMRGDAVVLPVIRKHIASLLWALDKVTVPKSGRVVICGARCHLAKDEKTGLPASDQSVMMDRFRQHVLGLKYKVPPGIDADLDWTSLWLLRRMPEVELLEMRSSLLGALPPVVQNPMTILRTTGGHVCWYDMNPEISASYFAYADHKTGEERYGFDPEWVKGHKVEGGKNPFKVPMPPGAETFRAVLPQARA